MPEAVEPLTRNMQAFVAFARKRVRDPHLAEDVVQESLLKALRAKRKPQPGEDVVAWFYRILRHSLIDVYRRTGAREHALERFKAELPDEIDAGAERVICQCVKRLLPELPASYRDLLHAVDLNGQSLKEAAVELGISANNLNVRLHRARQRLRKELERSCGVCSTHGCLNCSCDNPDRQAV